MGQDILDAGGACSGRGGRSRWCSSRGGRGAARADRVAARKGSGEAGGAGCGERTPLGPVLDRRLLLQNTGASSRIPQN
eukprot:226279-Rhodomonas_salina.1